MDAVERLAMRLSPEVIKAEIDLNERDCDTDDLVFGALMMALKSKVSDEEFQDFYTYITNKIREHNRLNIIRVEMERAELERKRNEVHERAD